MVQPPLFTIFPLGGRLKDLRNGVSLSTGELWDRVEARASELAAAGIGPDRCAIVAQAEPLDYLRDIFALWTVGAMAVAVNPLITQEERSNVRTATGANVILDGQDPLPATSAAQSSPDPLGFDMPALTLMSSGTTGRPKGIVHSQRSLCARIALNVAEIGTADLEQSLCVLPLHFGHGLIGNVLTVLAAGGSLCLWPQPSIDEMRSFGAIIARERITFMSSTPSFWSVAMRLSSRPDHVLQRVHVGSAPLSAAAWTAIADWTGTRRVLNMYGMTETANWIGGASLETYEARDGLVGKPWGGALALLIDDGVVSDIGSGEVLIASPSIMSRYLGMEQETAATFHGSWFRTGDTGTIDADGVLALTGRIKNEINRGGVKIPAEEIDMLLERHADVIEACTFALPDPVAGECVAAALVLRQGGDTEAIKAWCRERCRAEAVPTKLFVLDAIPRNDRGKIVRSTVRAAALASGAGAGP